MGQRVSIWINSLAIGLVVASTFPASGQSYEELKHQVAELTRRVEALEKRLGMSPPAASPVPAPVTGGGAGREEALALYAAIDLLLAAGKADEARQELEAFNDKHAGTPTARWSRALTRELEAVGKPAPADWYLEKWFQGESETTLDGRRGTILLFWEEWCNYCKKEIPRFQEVYERHKDAGLQVLGVTRTTRSATEESVRSFLEAKGISFPMAKETGALADYFHVKGIPAAAVINDGVIVWRGHPTRLTDEMLANWR